MTVAALIGAATLTAQIQFQVDNQTSNRYEIEIWTYDGVNCTDDCLLWLCCDGNQTCQVTILSGNQTG